MKITSLPFYKQLDPQKTTMSKEVLAAGNGYRSHGIAVPARSYTQNIIDPNSTAEEKLTPS